MTPFELEWLRSEKEQHTRLLYQLKRELADQRKDKPLAPTSHSELPRTQQKPIPGYRPASLVAH